MKTICKICNGPLEALNLVEHISQYHFLDYRDYYEIVLELPEDIHCWKCGHTLSYLCPYLRIENFLLPCPKCSKDYIYSKLIENAVVSYLQEFKNDKLFQEILATPEWIKDSLTHDIKEIEELILRNVPKYGKRTVVNLSYQPWAPHELSERNLENILFSKSELQQLVLQPDGRYKITLSGQDYFLLVPESSTYNPSHHGRYSILSSNPPSRKSKKLRFSSDKSCIKFWPTTDVHTKSIFQIKDHKDRVVNPLYFTDENKKNLKLAILRNPDLLDLVIKIYLEILHFSGNLIIDDVFIKNTILFYRQETKKLNFKFSWFPFDGIMDQINLSIL